MQLIFFRGLEPSPLSPGKARRFTPKSTLTDFTYRVAWNTFAGLSIVTFVLGCQSGLATGPGGPDNSPESQISGDGGVRADLDGATLDADAPSPFANRERFEAEVAGPLTDECGVCHLDETPAFMAGPNLYDAVMAWPGLVTPGAPSLSSILTTGVHTGPAFTPAAVTAVFRWIVGAQDNPDVDAGTPIGVGEGLPGGANRRVRSGRRPRQ